MIILGVDPGTQTTGYGLVEKDTSGISLIHSGIIDLKRINPIYDRIYKIFQSFIDIIYKFEPQELAIEEVFFAKNVKSALKIGHARGAVLIASVECGLRVFEYSPLEIKKAVVGYGRATKEQVRSMVRTILGIKDELGFDEADALATAICHANWVRYDQDGD
jgi:crossover junction endodeoxyribonuclease RuvC